MRKAKRGWLGQKVGEWGGGRQVEQGR